MSCTLALEKSIVLSLEGTIVKVQHTNQRNEAQGRDGVFGLEKLGVGNQTRKAKWCKMQVLGLKIDKTQGVKG